MPLIRGILRAARLMNLDTSAALGFSGIDSRTLAESDTRLPRTLLFGLMANMAKASGDDYFGLHLAEHATAGDFAVLDYAMRNSPTLGVSYEQMCRYSHVLHDGIDIKMDNDGTVVRLHYQEPAGSPRQLAEWVVALWIVVGRDMTSTHFPARDVTFQHAAPADSSEHARLFGVPAKFDQTHYSVSFDAAVLDRPLTGADPNLLRVVSGYCQELLATVERPTSFPDQVRKVVAELLRGGDATLETTAKRMAVAPRTLQRKLRSKDSSFQAVLDEVRCDLAKRYLAQSSLAIEETAFLLGFSEPSAFNRAFKRWTGVTPSNYRAQPSARFQTF
jgi:AraC-like DNA-binding protein